MEKLKEWENALWRGSFELAIGFITLGASADLGLAAGLLCILMSTTWLIFFFIHLASTGHPVGDGPAGKTEPPQGDAGYGYPGAGAPYVDQGYQGSGATYVPPDGGYPPSGPTNPAYADPSTTYVEPGATYPGSAGPYQDPAYPPQY
jgi:hypothetical protein